MIDRINEESRLSLDQIVGRCCFCRSRIYRWRQGELERKPREPKPMPEQTVESAALVIATYPHFSGRKGQAYMIYHRLGYIGMAAYDAIKKNVKRILIQEAASRNVVSDRTAYEHIRPGQVGEIWAEDFTELKVCGHIFKAALLIDVFDQYKLGVAVAARATAMLVAEPVNQALAANNGQGPKQFLLSDNGTQYVGEEHEELLSTADIVHRLIPACVPQYNGWVECEVKEFKNAFYNVWEQREREEADKGKTLLDRVRGAAVETARQLNEVIPRPSLGGVTPADVHLGRHDAKKDDNKKYLEEEKNKHNIQPWTRSYWDVLKAGLGLNAMTAKEVLTKLSFFSLRPLRRIAKLNMEVVG